MDINLKGNRILNLPSNHPPTPKRKKTGQLALVSNSNLKTARPQSGKKKILENPKRLQHVFFPGKTYQDHISTVAHSVWDVVPGI